MSAVDLLDGVARAIVSECGAIADLLVEKNRQYGNSALKPIRLFSRADAIEQIKVRIDDKLSRLQSGQDDDTEDTELDLLGYLVLLRVARKLAGATDKDSLTVAAAENSYLDKLRALRHGREGSSGYVVPPVDDGDDDPVVTELRNDGQPIEETPAECGRCGLQWPNDSEQAAAIREYGLCIPCLIERERTGGIRWDTKRVDANLGAYLTTMRQNNLQPDSLKP